MLESRFEGGSGDVNRFRPNDSVMRIDYLHEFVVTANTRSFGHAAKSLFMSPSALSKHIAQIESELDIKLFDRDRHHIELTREGKAFLEGAKQVLAAYDNAMSMVEAARRSVDQVLTIGFMRRATNFEAAALKRAIIRTSPRVEVQLLAFEYPDLLNNLFQRIIDVAVVMNVDPMLASSCQSCDLCVSKRCLAVKSSHKWAKLDSISSQQIPEEPLVLPDPVNEPDTFRRITSLVPGYKTAPAISYYRDIDSLILSVSDGDGVAVMPEIIKPHLDQGIALIPISDVDTSFTVSALCMKDADERIASTVQLGLQAYER